MRTKRVTLKAGSVSTDDAAGSVRALFSVFDVVDSDNEVTLPSFFEDGQPVPIAAWGHRWGDLAVGKGIIRVEEKGAVLDGKFFLDTIAGRETYLTVKNMAELQEWSFGFQVHEQQPGKRNGLIVTELVRGTTFEVSPVLVGANRETYTEAIKSAGLDQKCYGEIDGTAAGSFEELSGRLAEQFSAAQAGDGGMHVYSYTVATFTNHFVAVLWRMDLDEPQYWDVGYTLGSDGAITLGDMRQVEPQTSFVPVKGYGIGYELHAARAALVVGEYVKRVQAGLAVHAKEGRAISTTRRNQIEEVVSGLRAHADLLAAIHAETAPRTAEGEDETGKARTETLRLRSLFDRNRARLSRELGVSA